MRPHAALPLALAILTLVLLLPAPPAGAEEDAGLDLGAPEAVKKALGSRDARKRLAAARAAAALQDHMLTAPLVRLLKDDEAPIVEAALDALVARTEPRERKSAAAGIVVLLKPLPREPASEDIAREKRLVPALHDLAQPVAIDKLLDIHTEAPAELAKARLRAVGNTPCKEAIKELIDYGAKNRRGRGHRSAVAGALQYATGVKLGGDPDKWRAWWREAAGSFDFEAAAERRASEAQRAASRDERREEQRRKREERRNGGRERRRPRDGDGEEEGDEGG